MKRNKIIITHIGGLAGDMTMAVIDNRNRKSYDMWGSKVNPEFSKIPAKLNAIRNEEEFNKLLIDFHNSDNDIMAAHEYNFLYKQKEPWLLVITIFTNDYDAAFIAADRRYNVLPANKDDELRSGFLCKEDQAMRIISFNKKLAEIPKPGNHLFIDFVDILEGRLLEVLKKNGFSDLNADFYTTWMERNKYYIDAYYRRKAK